MLRNVITSSLCHHYAILCAAGHQKLLLRNIICIIVNYGIKLTIKLYKIFDLLRWRSVLSKFRKNLGQLGPNLISIKGPFGENSGVQTATLKPLLHVEISGTVTGTFFKVLR